MKVKSYLPNFDGQFSAIKKDAETELFQKLYNEKAAHMDQVRVLNFYGPPGAGKTWLMRTIYNDVKYWKNTNENSTGPVPSDTKSPVAVYCNILGGMATVISQIIRQSSKEYGFAFPLTCVCLYILSRTEEEETDNAFPLPELREAANYIGSEPEFQYLKQVLDKVPLGQNCFNRLCSQLLFDDQAPSSLRQLAESSANLLENLFAWPMPQLNPYRRSLYRRSSELLAARTMERQQKNRRDYLSAFFTSFFAADMEANLKAYTEPAVILLDGIDSLFECVTAADEQRKTEKWLCGTTGLLATVPNVFWVLSTNKKLNWEKDYLPDWKGALTQKALTVPKSPRPNTPARFSAAIWKQINTLDKKVQCVLQGLGIFNLDLAINACTALIEEYQGIPGFETECRNSIIKSIKSVNEDQLVATAHPHLPFNRIRDNYFCYDPETPSENKESLKYRFKAFFFAQQYYTAKINRLRLGNVDFEKSFRSENLTWKNQLSDQVYTVEELIDSTAKFINDKNTEPRRLRDFYFMAILPQVLDWTDLGLYSIAERILEKLKAVTSDNSNLFASVYGLGYAYLQKIRDNNNTEAARRVESFYKENVALSGKEDPVSVFLLNIVSYIKGNIPGQELAAYRERRECASILVKNLGKATPKTIRSICVLSPHLVDNGRSEAAETLSKICLDSATRLYGGNDLITLKCKSQYAFRLKAKGENRESAGLRQAVADNYEKIFGNYSPKTLSELESLANVLYALSKEDTEYEDGNAGSNNEAKEKELRLREDILNRYRIILQNETTENGESVHPLIREAAINVCDSLHNCGRPLNEIIQFAEHHLGKKDPGIITVLNNAAIDDSNNDKNDRAITTIKQAIELCKKQGIETYKGLKNYITCQISLAWFYAIDSTDKNESLALYKAIIKNCETLLTTAEKENNENLISESKLFTAKRFYNIAQIANYYYEENDLALEMLEKAVSLKLSVSAAKDEELNDYLELQREIKEMIT